MQVLLKAGMVPMVWYAVHRVIALVGVRVTATSRVLLLPLPEIQNDLKEERRKKI